MNQIDNAFDQGTLVSSHKETGGSKFQTMLKSLGIIRSKTPDNNAENETPDSSFTLPQKATPDSLQSALDELDLNPSIKIVETETNANVAKVVENADEEVDYEDPSTAKGFIINIRRKMGLTNNPSLVDFPAEPLAITELSPNDSSSETTPPVEKAEETPPAEDTLPVEISTVVPEKITYENKKAIFDFIASFWKEINNDSPYFNISWLHASISDSEAEIIFKLGTITINNCLLLLEEKLRQKFPQFKITIPFGGYSVSKDKPILPEGIEGDYKKISFPVQIELASQEV